MPRAPGSLRYPELFSLAGRVALVTGASRGIGRAIAKGYAEAGARVVVSSRRLEDCARVAEEIRAAGGEAHAVEADVGELAALEPLVASALSRFAALDILVNCAGVLKPHRIERLTAEELDELFRVNVRAAVFLSRAALPALEASGRGVIIHLTAVGGHAPMEGIGAYGASKAALLNWTRVMAREWSPRGVRVHALTPGSVATDMILPRDPALRARFEAEMAGRNLLGRIAAPEELVGPAIFLASDAASFMTGQALIVDGGMLA